MDARAVAAESISWKRWFALLGGALAWTAHLLLAYGIAEFGCVAGWGERGFAAISAVAWLVLGMSAVMAAVAVGAVIVSGGIRRRARSEVREADDKSTAEYIGRFGLIANWLFLGVILVESLPILFYLGSC